VRKIIEYILKNKEWMFSGCGLAVPPLVYSLWRHVLSSRLSPSARLQDSAGKPANRHQNDQFLHRFEFSDGVVAYARIRHRYQITDLRLYFTTAKDQEHCTSLIGPEINSRACSLLEPFTYAEAKLHRREVEMKLQKEFSATYAAYGLTLHGITISSFERPPKTGMPPV